YIDTVSEFCPEVKDIDISSAISDNITLSTMHGCPPDEIGKIASYLIEECGYHTNVKLNPTLLGPNVLRKILNEDLGYRDITVPDLSFEHDLKFEDAVPMLNMLKEKAEKKNVEFGVKLANTLEVENNRNVFDKNETVMYMSGRPLQAITVNVAKKLAVEFDGKLMISYAGGADCFNVSDLIRCGMKTVTVSSDILRPGGYTRMLQYIKNLRRDIEQSGSSNIPEFICNSAKKMWLINENDENRCSVEKCALENLKQYAGFVLEDPQLIRDTYERKNTKTSRELGLFDCIKAPCTDICPVSQKVPSYIRQILDRDIEEAAATVRNDNPLSAILGRACDHSCELKCTRTHYDEPVAIRELKRYIIDSSEEKVPGVSESETDISIAVVGAGPGGLAAAYFLAKNGCGVTIYEERERAAGMVSKTIPGYRATDESIAVDVELIEGLGVKFKYNCKIGKDILIQDLTKNNDYVIIAAGAQKGVMPGIEGETCEGVIDGIDFLHRVKSGDIPQLGENIGVIGAGDVAMDCARAANRLSKGKVSVIYRRTIEEMPAHKEELDALFDEGIDIKELCSPKSVIEKGNRITALKCLKMKLGEPDESGRRRPIPIENSEFEMELDNLILAIGQKPDFSFLKSLPLNYNRKGYIVVDSSNMKTKVDKFYAVGDAVEEGPQTIVKACGDGKKAAKDILSKAGIELRLEDNSSESFKEKKDFIRKRSLREFRVEVPELPIEKRDNFDEIVQTLNEEEAEQEAERCLECDSFCSTCVSVCPNKALFTYETVPFAKKLPVLNSGEEEEFKIKQKYQVAVFTSFCNECANCTAFCPSAGDPYSDKPRLYNSAEEFHGQENNAFMIFENDGIYSIKGKFDGDIYELKAEDGKLKCSNLNFDVLINEETFEIERLDSECKDQMSLKNFALMYTVLKGVTSSMPEIPFN
ncbi:MAG: FAD-dependent oxidoreductase, partial [Victivallales bacterium]|nr:FAD-dependent oxidoreductase [Victivallales bacterium]